MDLGLCATPSSDLFDSAGNVNGIYKFWFEELELKKLPLNKPLNECLFTMNRVLDRRKKTDKHI